MNRDEKAIRFRIAFSFFCALYAKLNSRAEVGDGFENGAVA